MREQILKSVCTPFRLLKKSQWRMSSRMSYWIKTFSHSGKENNVTLPSGRHLCVHPNCLSGFSVVVRFVLQFFWICLCLRFLKVTNWCWFLGALWSFGKFLPNANPQEEITSLVQESSVDKPFVRDIPRCCHTSRELGFGSEHRLKVQKSGVPRGSLQGAWSFGTRGKCGQKSASATSSWTPNRGIGCFSFAEGKACLRSPRGGCESHGGTSYLLSFSVHALWIHIGFLFQGPLIHSSIINSPQEKKQIWESKWKFTL